MAKITGCQPDFRTSLIGGERRAIMTHAGISSRKKPHTAGGRYHMSGEQQRIHLSKIFENTPHII